MNSFQPPLNKLLALLPPLELLLVKAPFVKALNNPTKILDNK